MNLSHPHSSRAFLQCLQATVTADTPTLGFHYSSPYPDAMEPFVATSTTPKAGMAVLGQHRHTKQRSPVKSAGREHPGTTKVLEQ